VTTSLLRPTGATAASDVRRAPLLPELVVVALLLFAYDRVRSLAHPRVGPALSHGEDLLRWEQDLHIAVERTANTWLHAHAGVQWLAGLWYQSAHITVSMALLGWLWWRHPARYRGARNSLVIINLIGLVVFTLLPVMPPRLLPGGRFIDAVEASGMGSAPVGPVPSDQYAAMPSLHLAWATWVAFYGALIAGPALLRWVWRAYPFVTGAVVVMTANHYVFDIAGGVLVAVVAVPLGVWLSPATPSRNDMDSRRSRPAIPSQAARGSAAASADRARGRPAQAEPTR